MFFFVFLWNRDWFDFPHVFSKFFEKNLRVRSEIIGKNELPRDSERCSVEIFCWGCAGVQNMGPESKQYSWQWARPVPVSIAHNGCFEGMMPPLDHSIRRGMVSSRTNLPTTGELQECGKQTRFKLTALIGGHRLGRAESRYPAVHESSTDGECFDVLDRYCLGPARKTTNHGEAVLKTVARWEKTDQVHMNVFKTTVRRHELGRSQMIMPRHFRPLAV